MLAGIIVVIGIAVIGVVIYVLHANAKAERQKYYDAAYKVIKEECLNNAIRNQNEKIRNGQKLMLYLKWKDSEKQGYVFDPEKPVRIGRVLKTVRFVFGRKPYLPSIASSICIRVDCICRI